MVGTIEPQETPSWGGDDANGADTQPAQYSPSYRSRRRNKHKTDWIAPEEFNAIQNEQDDAAFARPLRLSNDSRRDSMQSVNQAAFAGHYPIDNFSDEEESLDGNLAILGSGHGLRSSSQAVVRQEWDNRVASAASYVLKKSSINNDTTRLLAPTEQSSADKGNDVFSLLMAGLESTTCSVQCYADQTQARFTDEVPDVSNAPKTVEDEDQDMPMDFVEQFSIGNPDSATGAVNGLYIQPEPVDNDDRNVIIKPEPTDDIDMSLLPEALSSGSKGRHGPDAAWRHIARNRSAKPIMSTSLAKGRKAHEYWLKLMSARDRIG